MEQVRALASAESTSTARVDRTEERAARLAARGRHAAAARVWWGAAAAARRRGDVRAAARGFIRLAEQALDRGHPDAALSVLAQAGAIGGRWCAGEVAMWHTAALVDAGRFEEAARHAQTALDALDAPDGSHAGLATALARARLWQERVADATRVLDRVDPSVLGADAYTASTAVRVWLAAGRTFDAGRLLGAVERAVPGGATDARTLLVRMARLRLQLATGDLDTARAGLITFERHARSARQPLRAVRARLAWLEALWRAGETDRVVRELPRLRRLTRLLPSLRIAVSRLGQGAQAPGAGEVREAGVRSHGVAVPAAVALADATRGRCDAERAARFADILARETGGRGGWLAVVVPRGLQWLCGADSAPLRAMAERARVARRALGPEVVEGQGMWAVPIVHRATAVGVLGLALDRPPDGEGLALIECGVRMASAWLAALAGVDGCQPDGLMPELVGESQVMQDLRTAIVRAAQAPFPVLIEGESGVGKELVARAIHRLGPRAQRPFRDLNCAALPDELADAELFGHTRGAFTGAAAERRGLLEDADGGTVFFDELGDLSPRAQAKLLRALQQREVRRLGESRTRPIDVRVVSAANQDLRCAVREGRFREDLLYRLDVIRLAIPPLRARVTDIPALASLFWREAAAAMGSGASIGEDVLEALSTRDWPGNVRQLQSVLRALAAHAPADGTVGLGELRRAGDAAAPASAPPVLRLAAARADADRRCIEAALARYAGRRAEAARALGITRQGLAKLLQRYGR